MDCPHILVVITSMLPNAITTGGRSAGKMKNNILNITNPSVDSYALK